VTTGRTDRRGVQAVRALQEADNLDATPRLSHGDEVVYSLEAERARAKGEILLQPRSMVLIMVPPMGAGIMGPSTDLEPTGADPMANLHRER